MDKDQDNLAVSARYTAATWAWAGLPQAEVLTPANAESVFRFVNRCLRFYRWINPAAYSLPHQLLHRHAAIDHLLRTSGLVHTVEIACGFSPRGAHFSADPAHRYVEIDLPDMIAAKRRQLAASSAGQAILDRPNHALVAGDVTRLDFAGLVADHPTCFITEGLMMYFAREAQMPIWRALAAALRPAGGEYFFDYIPLSEEPPRSAPGRVLHRIRLACFGQGDFAYDARDRHAVAADLRECGFDAVEIFSTGDIARDWGLPQADVPTRTLVYRCRVRPQGAAA